MIDKNTERFFDSLNLRGDSEVSLIVVGHFTEENQVFLNYLNSKFNIALVICKPGSISTELMETLPKSAACKIGNRNDFMNIGYVSNIINWNVMHKHVIIVDVGGYFSYTIAELQSRIAPLIIGVVEVTENGYQRYMHTEASRLPCPVYVVARSSIKEPENHLVGQSVVIATEFLLRKYGVMLAGKECAVFGYGKLGRSVARCLSSKSALTRVVETNPILGVQALAAGFPVIGKDQALAMSEIIFGCTGNQCLSVFDMRSVRNGAFISSVTSPDDEFDFSGIDAECVKIKDASSEDIDAYETIHEKRRFYMLNSGKAMNFKFGALSSNLGHFSRLVQAEVIESINMILSGRQAGLYELDEENRKAIAAKWLSLFNESD
jgi:adenosylhomocysteinase